MEEDFYSRSNIIKRQYDYHKRWLQNLEKVVYNSSPTVYWEQTDEYISPEEFRKRWAERHTISVENQLKLTRVNFETWEYNLEKDNERSK